MIKISPARLHALVDHSMRLAYLDCFSGISGDMFLGALVDAGVPESLFHETIAALNRAADFGLRLEIRRSLRSGISATKVDVFCGEKRDEPRVEHHHYREHHHGHVHEHAHEEVLGHSHGSQSGDGANHHAPHRGLNEIREIISRAGLSESAKPRALDIFQRLGEAEAKIHSIPVEQVHFHEVGAADALADIVCAAVGSEALGVTEWICSPLNVGSGSVECAHGRFPVPAPATAELLKQAPVFSSGLEAELVTPTGAAIVASLASRYASLPQLRIEKIGYGAGTRDFAGHANVVRLIVGETAAPAEAIAVPGTRHEVISALECTIDDLNPQVLAYAAEKALAEGALETFITPVQMKKSRAGSLLTVLARPEDSARLAGLIFRETSTLGLRVRHDQRLVLPREHAYVMTQFGEVRVKISRDDQNVIQAAPEFEDCRRLAEQHHIPLKQVMEEALRNYRQSAEQPAHAGKA